MHTTHMVSVTANCHSSSKTQNSTFENLNVQFFRKATKITNVFYEQDGDDEHEMKIDFFLSLVSLFCFARSASLIFLSFAKIKRETTEEKKEKRMRTKQFK